MGVDFIIPMGGRNVHGSKYESSSAAAASSSSPDSYYNQPPSPNHRRLKLLWILLGSIGILAGVALLICRGIFAFRHLEKLIDCRKRLPLFWVDSVSISNFSFTNGSSRVLMDSQVQLTARNPNLVCSLNYQHIVTSIYYKHELLFQSGLPPFSQETKNETTLVAKFAGEGNVVDRWVMDGMDSEFGKNGSIGFNLWFSSSIGLCNYSSTLHTLEVLCKDLVVGFPGDGAPGRLIRQPENCLVGEESNVHEYLYDYEY